MEKEIKVRLIKYLSFLEKELEDYKKFKSLSWEEYQSDRDKRRNVERWIENIVNSSIDIAKVILVAENLPLPDTYREILVSLSLVSGFDKKDAENLAEWVKFRNILSHEYLDIRWHSIKRFIAETETLYKNFSTKLKKYINQKL